MIEEPYSIAPCLGLEHEVEKKAPEEVLVKEPHPAVVPRQAPKLQKPTNQGIKAQKPREHTEPGATPRTQNTGDSLPHLDFLQ